MKTFICGLLLLCSVAAAPASIINVPGGQPTIQAGINAAVNGDTVLVAPGTYKENINFNGKRIIVKSSNGPKVTIIDGGLIAPVATFSSGETLKSVLKGFTLQNGTSTFNSQYDGGGVYINASSPTIMGNIIQNNFACNGGGGIAVEFASPLIQNNKIRNNMQSGCSGGIGGAGIAVGGAAAARIIGNTIENNIWGSGDGGGITLFAAGAPTIQNNIIRGNTATGVSPAAQGGGIWIVNDSDALVEQNLIYNNNAGQGGGIYFGVPSGSRGPFLINNTIVGNSASQGSAVFAGGFDNQVQLYNNLLIGLNGENAVDCDGTYSQQPPSFFNNDAFSVNGTGLLGTCASQSSQNNNISADPMFVSVIKNNYKLQAGSAAIDTGTNSAPSLLPKDLAKKPRIVDGNSDGNAVIDMGAYEFQ